MDTKNTNGIMKTNNFNSPNWMRKLWVYALFLVASPHFAQGQDTLYIKHPIEVKITDKHGNDLKFKNLIAAAKAEELPEVVKHFRVARVYHVIGNGIGLPGAFIFGYALGYGITSPDGIDGQVLLLGLGMVGFQYTMAATLRDPQVKKGVRKYNEALYQKRQRMNEEANVD
jgi:hypothetical protein